MPDSQTTKLDWIKSGVYQAWVRTDKGHYFIWHSFDGRYACEFMGPEEGHDKDYKQNIFGRFENVGDAKVRAEQHYAGI